MALRMGDMPMQPEISIVEPLRQRFTAALAELAACREALNVHGLPLPEPKNQECPSSISCNLEDHADVLIDPSLSGPTVSSPLVAAPITEAAAAAAAAAATASSSSSSSAARRCPGPGGTTGTASASASAAAAAAAAAAEAALAACSAGSAASSSEWEARPTTAAATADKVRLEEELSVAKALLMLNGVQLSMDLNDDALLEEPTVTQVKGNRKLIQALLTLQQKVSLLNQQYLLLRGDMLYLSNEMNVCRHWVVQSFRAALQSQSQDASNLQTRFERLSKVLN
mmetsp:Transcript_26556/g.57666  ORF Transcript_26556/g.57666 Transcript_26556/m.57666 type:complete len:284 (-) Transcript_26556:79-930(-)